ncbi:unnamed protein product [Effrenium voratum]|nr:unnamed protein product [Effrenium voratum]
MRALARVAARRALRGAAASVAKLARGHASSALVAGEAEAEEAARKLIEKLPEKRNGLLLYLAKGYGARSECIGPLLHEHLGSDAVVLGCNSEGGVMAQGRELQKETFALAALLLDLPGLQARPFAGDLEQLPSLKRGGRWSSGTDRSALAFCSLPVSAGDPQSWVCMLDIALTGRSGRPPVLVGGMPVGGYAYVDGEMKASGAFGVVLEGASCSPVVCQGSEPFGPFMEITAVQQQHVIREINGQSPRDLLLPLLNGPQVPGTGSSMAGIFVDPKPESGEHGSWTDAHLAAAALGGRPNCLSRPMHAFTQEGYLVLSPLTDMTPYAPGMQLQLQCFSPQHVSPPGSHLQHRLCGTCARGRRLTWRSMADHQMRWSWCPAVPGGQSSMGRRVWRALSSGRSGAATCPCSASSPAASSGPWG